MWGTLLHCAAINPERARVGRILAAILLLFTGLAASSASLPLVRGTGSLSPIIIITVVVLVILYLINRRGYVTVAGTGLTVTIIGIMVAVALTPTSTIATGLLSVTALVIPVALAGVMMPWRGVIGVLLVTSAVTVAMYMGASPVLRAFEQANPGVVSGALFFAIVILWASGGLSILASSQIWLTVARLEQQNGHLLTQNARERSLLNQLSTTGIQVREAAASIATLASQQAQGATEQSAALTQVSSMIEELNQTAQQIASVADMVARVAEQTLHRAQNGQEAVQAGIVGMNRIMARIEDIVSRSLSLTSQSQRMAEIVTTINEIASQTHILALNAAIESAGAGEAGTRFGVIAGEVRKLAQHSTTATHEIQAIINEHQAAIAAAVMATEEGLKEGSAGLELAERSGAANAAIISEVEQAAELMHTINKATQQQQTASAQAVLTMHEMVEVTRQVAASSRQTLEAVRQLHTIAQELVVAEEAAPPGMPAATRSDETGSQPLAVPV
jgi:hypothetical protein